MSEDIVGTDRECFEFNDFNLLNISKETELYWKQPERSLLHNAISCVISMRIPFKKSREIRKKIYTSIGKEGKIELTRDNFKFKDKTLLSYGLSNEQVRIIREILNNDIKTIKDLTKIKGIGIWTIKAIKILMNIDSDISLEQDYYIRNNLTLLYGYKKVMTETEAKKILQTWKGNRSQICYMLWRIKKEGIEKIIEEQKLTKYDFIGYDKDEEKKEEKDE